MAQTQLQTQTQSAMDTLPTLTTVPLTSPADKQSALKLVADSIAQQRQTASYYLITRPLHLTLLFASYAIIHALNPADITLTIITASGLTLTYLLFVRFLTGDYIRLAEAFRWRSFIRGPADDKDDVVLATRYGEEIIGTLVLRLQPAEGKAVIRAWTVLVRYRGKGIGSDLLHQAARLAKKECGRDCAVEFAADHANSAQVVAASLGRPFEARDRKAWRALGAALADL